jgi:5-bromo-4-chloroindolyl phosphate hydrolysis protein
MQKEYKIFEVKLSEAEEKMNEMSKHGWEVVSTNIHSFGMAHTKAGTPMLIVFEREINKE